MRKLEIKVCDWCGNQSDKLRLCRITQNFRLKKNERRIPALCPDCYEKRNELEYKKLILEMYKKDKIFEILKVGLEAQFMEAIK